MSLISSGLRAGYVSSMTDGAQRYAWWTLAGILILLLWAVLRLWLAE